MVDMELSSGNVIRLIQTHPVSVVTSVNENGVCDAASFSWISPASFDPPMLALMVSKKRYTYKNIEETGEFVVNVVTKHFLDETVEVGRESFRENPNKIDDSGFSLTDSKEVEPSRIDEAVVWLECEVEKMTEAGDHVIVVGKILTAEVEDDFWDNGRFLAEKAETLQHLGGNKFLVGGELVEHED